MNTAEPPDASCAPSASQLGARKAAAVTEVLITCESRAHRGRSPRLENWAGSDRSPLIFIGPEKTGRNSLETTGASRRMRPAASGQSMIDEQGQAGQRSASCRSDLEASCQTLRREQ